MITTNSFMKREFGKRLIEECLPRWNLDQIVNTSGAYIPGHGTPTVLLFGSNEPPFGTDVLSVLAKRGEPATPEDAEKGLVWRSIADHSSEVGFENEYVSVAHVRREVLAKHPWSLGGGGAAELKALLEGRAKRTLVEMADAIGFVCMTRADDIYFSPRQALVRAGVAERYIIENVEGEVVRDWAMTGPNTTLFPYESSAALEPTLDPYVIRFLWPFRTMLWLRREPNGNHKEIGMTWWEWSRFQRERYRAPLKIAFAEVATHNHFVLDRGGKVFKQTAPIIKLPETATEDDHLALLAYLNSSTATFLCRQLCMSKGSQGINEGLKAEAWEQFVQRSGTALSKIAVAPDLSILTGIAARLLNLAAEQADASAQVLRPNTAGPAQLAETARKESEARIRYMALLQEELDWLVYERFGLLSEAESTTVGRLREVAVGDICEPANHSNIARAGLSPGHRPFEVVLAREHPSTAWFARNGCRSPDEIPAAYAKPLCDLIEARVAVIESNPLIRLLEQPEHKRRWQVRGFDAALAEALDGQLAGTLEAAAHGSETVQTRASLRGVVSNRAESAELLALRWPDQLPEPALNALVDGDAVPFLAAYRFTAVGLERHAHWQSTWGLQRREDAGETVGEIPVPPKYDQKDYRDAIYWRLRGKLDVPKERFISYPGCESDQDGEPIYGWAGWNHLQRVQALAALYRSRKEEEGWKADRLTPMLAGLAELLPWVKQWHNDVDPEFGYRLGDWYESYVQAQCRELGLTADDLRNWRPVRATRSRAVARRTTEAGG